MIKKKADGFRNFIDC
ncbi:MAG: hypothetical protein ACQZ3N_05580 [cyanobacterium endosymbiont of Rhopalodia yunnanensis]